MSDRRLFNPEAENSVVGALLVSNSSIDLIADILKPEHFADWRLAAVFTEACSQIGRGMPCDIVTVYEVLGEKVMSLVELNAITQLQLSPSSIKAYADIVVDRYQRRQIAATSEKVRGLLHDYQRTSSELVEAALGAFTGLLMDGGGDEWIGADAGMIHHLDLIEQRERGEIHSMATGLQDLDELLEGGLRTGNLVILGARPAMGKTALGMTIGLHMARHYSVGLLSMEMPHRDVRDRMVAALGRVSLSSVIRPNKGSGLDWTRVAEGVEAAKHLKFFVSDKSNLNVNQVKAKARALKRVHKLDLLIVDYLGLMQGLDGKQSRAYQIEEITKGLKSLAKDLDITIIALAQLSRNIEQRVNRRPMLSDFRDSGSIEQDADIVMGLHREIADKPDLPEEWRNYAELVVLKNRQGRTGELPLFYQGEYTSFTGWSGERPRKAREDAPRSRGFNG